MGYLKMKGILAYIAVILATLYKDYVTCSTHFNILYLFTTDEELKIANITLQYINQAHKAELGDFTFLLQFYKLNNVSYLIYRLFKHL